MEVNSTNNKLKYAKRNWYKGSLYFRETNKIEYSVDRSYNEVIFYMSDRTIVTQCYNPNVIEVVKKINPKEKVRVWFSAESKNYYGKWYTNLILKHVEVPRLEEIEKQKEKFNTSGGLDFNHFSEEF